MEWTELHAAILSKALEKILGNPEKGSMAFIRCLTPDIVKALSLDRSFAPNSWEVRRVADLHDNDIRTITADQAVEIREAKGGAALLLVDTAKAGAGMDGIYSAAREIGEASLFDEALRLVGGKITRKLSRDSRLYAERAVKKARGYGRRFSVSLWTEFDFLVRIAAYKKHPGEFLYLLGLWPVENSEEQQYTDWLDISRMFVDRLLEKAVSGLTPARRIETLRLLHPSDEQTVELERFLISAASKPIFVALAELADNPKLWVNSLRIEGLSQIVQSIQLSPWRTNTGKIAKWSGLEELDLKEPPELILRADADKTGGYSKLEVKWKATPENLEKCSVQYHVSIVTDMDEELASREVTHLAKKEQKTRFSNDDFSSLNENALISAKVTVSAIGNESVETQESEEFIIRFGEPHEHERVGGGQKVRTFSEGLMELGDRDAVSNLVASMNSPLLTDSRGFVLLRTPQNGKNFRVLRYSLIHEVEKQWAEHAGEIGRWSVKVRASGERAGGPEFIPISHSACPSLQRAQSASHRMAERFSSSGGGVAQIYDEKSNFVESIVKEYLLAWATLLEGDEPALALANTVEVQSLSGRTIGLIVLPSHPLRVAWHVAYDNLVFHARFGNGGKPKDIREELRVLDGALYPSFLPGVKTGNSFVFADMLGFHAVGMVPDCDKEPKAAVAILARALGERETAETTPTVGKQSAQVLGNEIIKYLSCHEITRLLHIHALRPGDGMTISRSLGRVKQHYDNNVIEDEVEHESVHNAPAFVLELYPSHEQRGLVGRFIADAREKRRSGAGVLSNQDSWMLESLSLPGQVNFPRLRWARKSEEDPQTAAHLAVAFDTFESRVVTESKEKATVARPLYAFGLLSFFDRLYSRTPSPLWLSCIPDSLAGEKHPSDRTHSERLVRLQQAIQKCVALSLGSGNEWPALRTEISPEKAQNLATLHKLCDWVITLDRNAGIEYFDSPLDDKEIYDAYVIDCVPEREDLGCLQLITSTSNLEEVRNLLDGALDQMGMSRSLRNAEFLMEHLKALSGRLAIRLTGQKAPRSELIALAISHANCLSDSDGSGCWVSLQKGFFIPVDDVRDLLPPISANSDNLKQGKNEEKESRPDLIYVSLEPRKGLLFRFVEVKYRRHLRTARTPELLKSTSNQVESLHYRWNQWYSQEEVCSTFRAIRRAKLARVLIFYADKARRHCLPREKYEAIALEIGRMVEGGGDYAFANTHKGDRGWVFCPEYAGLSPLEISPPEWDTRIFMFGPGLLPDSDFRRESMAQTPGGGGRRLYSSTYQDQETKQSNDNLEAVNSSKDSEAKQLIGRVVGVVEDTETGMVQVPSICFGKDVFTNADVRWQITLKGNPHLLIAGLPGMGKTTCLLNLCKQMLTAGIRPIVFSYHEDLDQGLERMVDSVRYIDFHGLGFNPLQVMDRQSSRMAYLDVAGAVRDIFVAIFPELGDIQAGRIRKAIKDSFVEAGWDDPNVSPAAKREPDFKRFVEILRDDPKPDHGLRTLLGRLDELDDYGFFELGESLESLWDSEDPIVIRVHSTQDPNLQKAFASLVFYGLYKDMFRRGIQHRITHAIVFDEAHRAAGLKLIPTMAKECRKYGISLVLASQEARDFNISLFSAIANYLVLRLTEADAKALVRNVTSSQQERMHIDKIKQMERFRALYFCEGKNRPSYVSLSS